MHTKAMPKTWKEKYNNGRQPVVEVLDKNFADLKAGTTMLISTPEEVDAEVRTIPKGETRSVLQIRQALAKKHNAAGTCPLTTGIFLRIVCECALEDLAAGTPKQKITPFWRAVDPNSPLAKKLSCGPDMIRSLLAEELA
jgi:hypothetical protein